MTAATDLKATYPPDTGLRIGTAHVDSVTGAVTVDVSGKDIDCSYVDQQGFIEGVPVAVLRGAASWIAMGRILTQPIARETGSVAFTFVAQTGATSAVSFGHTFPTIPKVFTNINSGAGVANGWNSRAFGITQTGFTMFVFGPSASWTGITVDWLAIG